MDSLPPCPRYREMSQPRAAHLIRKQLASGDYERAHANLATIRRGEQRRKTMKRMFTLPFLRGRA